MKCSVNTSTDKNKVLIEVLNKVLILKKGKKKRAGDPVRLLVTTMLPLRCVGSSFGRYIFDVRFALRLRIEEIKDLLGQADFPEEKSTEIAVKLEQMVEIVAQYE